MKFVLVVVLMSLLAAPVSAANSSRFSITLQGRVPVVCNISTGSMTKLSDGQFKINSVKEFCNTPSGYRVYAVHSRRNSGNLKNFTYSGRSISPNSSGQTLLYDARGPARRSRALGYTLNEGVDQNISVTLRIVAK